MHPTVLYIAYAVVMTGALVAFLGAYRWRLDTPRHKRWGLAGVGLTLAGIAVVLLLNYAVGWTVPKRFPDVVRVHRTLALFATALTLLVAVSGAKRWAFHTKLYIPFFPLYVATVVTALIGYGP